MDMEYRKLINFGNTSLVISLPKPWINQHKLKKGDVIYLENSPESITLFPRNREDVKEEESNLSIEIDNYNLEVIERKIVAGYIQAFDNIIFTGKSLGKKSAEIRKVIKKLVAFEIIEESSNKMVAKGFVDMKEVDLERTIRRIDNMVRSMFLDIFSIAESSKNVRQEMSQSLTLRDEDVNKMVFLNYRFINHMLKNKQLQAKIDPADLLKNWMLANHLEEIADNLKRISRIWCVIDKGPLLKEIKERLEDVQKLFLLTMNGAYTKDKESMHNISQNRKPMLKSADELLERSDQNRNIYVYCDKEKQLISSIHAIMRLYY